MAPSPVAPTRSTASTPPAQSQPPGGGTGQSPACPSGPLFSLPPIALDKTLAIIPLGNLSPPDHTLPTDHIYLAVKNHNAIEPQAITGLVAPGDLTIVQVAHSVAKIQGVVRSDDYSIDFSLCREVMGRFGHVTALAPALKALLEQRSGQCMTQAPRPGDEYRHCRYQLSSPVKAGASLGEVGGGTPTGLDWQMTDRRRIRLAYANPSRYYESAFYFACPLDFYEGQARAALSAKLGGPGQRRTVEPLCGAVAQDLPGTAQGNWFTGGPQVQADSPETWGKGLALVHDNLDGVTGVVSIGGVVAEPTKLLFQPKREGTFNREFSEVRADGQVYCYEGSTNLSGPPSPPRHVLLQMNDATTMRVEYRAGSCPATPAFTNPTTYTR